MVFALGLAVVLILGSDNPTQGLIFAVAITLIFNLLTFFLAPFLMDLTQSWLYHTRWVDFSDIEIRSPETARVLRRVCQQKNLKMPRLGIIDDNNPTAFTYGSLPNSARLVVSEGLFKYLDDDEIATVYAHELGHIVHWDFAVMTVASTLVQMCYLIYTTFRQFGRGDSGYKFGSDMMLQDRSGLLYLHYASRFGPIGNFLFGMKRVESLIGHEVGATGWFRRGAASYMDLIQLKSESGTVVNSYHRFWSLFFGSMLTIGGIICVVLIK